MNKRLYDRELNLGTLDGMSVVTMKALDVPGRLWTAVQDTQYGQVTDQIVESLPAGLSPVEHSAELARAAARAALITDFEYRGDYADRRRLPNEFEGQRGNNPDQIYKDPCMTIVFDRQGRVAASILAVINASPTFSGLAGKIDRRIKVHSPPWLPSGGYRYIRLSDMVIAEEPAALVAAAAYAVGRYNPKEKVSAYRMLTPAGEPDPADAETEWFVSTAGLAYTDSRHITDSPGYPGGALQQRFEGAAGDIKQELLVLGGAAISGMNRLSTAPSLYYMH